MLITFSFILARLYPPRKTFAAHITISFGCVRKLTFGKAANQKVHSCAGAFLLFATSGGSGIEDSVADLRKTLPQANVKDGLLANISGKIEPWLKDNGML